MTFQDEPQYNGPLWGKHLRRHFDNRGSAQARARNFIITSRKACPCPVQSCGFFLRSHTQRKINENERDDQSKELQVASQVTDAQVLFFGLVFMREECRRNRRPLRVTLLGAFFPRPLLEDLVARTAPPHRAAPSSPPRVAGCGCLATRTPHIGRYAMGKGIEPSLPSLVSRTAQRTLESTIFRFDRCASFWDFLARQRSPSAQCSERQHATVVSSTAVSAPSARVTARAFVCSIAFRVRKRPE